MLWAWLGKWYGVGRAHEIGYRFQLMCTCMESTKRQCKECGEFAVIHDVQGSQEIMVSNFLSLGIPKKIQMGLYLDQMVGSMHGSSRVHI